MKSLQESIHPQMVLFLVDGMRPDGLVPADTPIMEAIVQQGTFTRKARTVFPSVTLPCHTSLFQSVPPERHGILSNTWVPQARSVPGGGFYGWEQLRDLASPGSLASSLIMTMSQA